MIKRKTVQVRSKRGNTALNNSIIKINNQKLSKIEEAQIVSYEASESSLTQNRTGTTPEASGIIGFVFSMLVVGIFKGLVLVITLCFKFCFKLIALIFGFFFKMATDEKFRNPTQENGAIEAIKERQRATRHNIKDARGSNIHIHNY